VGLERGPLSLVSTVEELLGRTSSCSGLEIREYGHGDPSRWPRDTVYSQKLALTSPTSCGRSVSIVRSRTKATELLLVIIYLNAWLKNLITYSVTLVSKRTIPTERPPLVGEVSANFCG
jgi:hypothetical protein